MSSKPERFKFHLLLIFPPTPCQKCLHAGNSLRGKMARRRAAGEKHHRFYCWGESGRPTAFSGWERGKAPRARINLGLVLASIRAGVVLHVRIMCYVLERGGPFLKQCDGHFSGPPTYLTDEERSVGRGRDTSTVTQTICEKVRSRIQVFCLYHSHLILVTKLTTTDHTKSIGQGHCLPNQIS